MSSGGDCTHCRVCPIYIKDRLGIFISKASSPWALPRQFMLYSDYFASIYDMTFAQRKLPVPSPLGLKVRALQQLHASQLLRHGKCYNITVSWAMQELFSEISADPGKAFPGERSEHSHPAYGSMQTDGGITLTPGLSDDGGIFPVSAVPYEPESLVRLFFGKYEQHLSFIAHI